MRALVISTRSMCCAAPRPRRAAAPAGLGPGWRCRAAWCRAAPAPGPPQAGRWRTACRCRLQGRGRQGGRQAGTVGRQRSEVRGGPWARWARSRRAYRHLVPCPPLLPAAPCSPAPARPPTCQAGHGQLDGQVVGHPGGALHPQLQPRHGPVGLVGGDAAKAQRRVHADGLGRQLLAVQVAHCTAQARGDRGRGTGRVSSRLRSRLLACRPSLRASREQPGETDRREAGKRAAVCSGCR